MITTKLSPEDAAAKETAEARLARQRAMLQELAEIGMSIARAIRAQSPIVVETQADMATRRDLDLTLARTYREVRLTRALEARLARQAAELKDRAEADVARRAVVPRHNGESGRNTIH